MRRGADRDHLAHPDLRCHVCRGVAIWRRSRTVAHNPKTQLFSAAIIGDTGPKDNLGEGSVLLNMKLLGRNVPPTNKAETFKLSIDNTQVLVAIIPASRVFQEIKPDTTENINQRVEDWQKEAGFATPEKFIEFMQSFQPQLQ
jgi:hypothetical protein